MGVQCQSPLHIYMYMHNYMIATVLYESFVWEERGGDREKREKD